MNTTEQSTSLPAGLAGVLNRPEEQRDSAYYSNMDTSSKHNSTQSTNGHQILTPPNSGYQSSIADHTPSPIATNMTNPPLPSPNSGSMSVASLVSPTTDQSMLRKLDTHRQSYESGQVTNGDSRRESINSQLGFGDLRLAGSPYASNNQSTTSIQSTLQQQRHPQGVMSIRGGIDRGSMQRYSSGYSQQAAQVERAKKEGPKNAPAITGPSEGVIARGTEPTPGHGWAFPEEPVVSLSSPVRPSAESMNRNNTSFYDDSRRNSATSLTSTHYATSESRVPIGQRRLEDGIAGDSGYQRQSRASSEFMAHHHHSLQHKAINDLQSDAGSPGSTSQPYSRTPELRVSHKLAERKRRTEMKELFDNLRDLMPQERGSKASKWEILTKAIAEYQKLHDVIAREQTRTSRAVQEADTHRRDNESLRRENDGLRREIAQMRAENTNLAGTLYARQDPAHAAAIIPQFTSPQHPVHTIQSPTALTGGGYTGDRFGSSSEQNLPPLRNVNGATESMNGIQYHDSRARVEPVRWH